MRPEEASGIEHLAKLGVVIDGVTVLLAKLRRPFQTATF